MANSEFDVELFERKLQTLKDSQESIQALSSWCLERRVHHKKIVAAWLQVLKKVKVEHRLTLFYLANDVIQYSKRKNFEFVESWGTTLQRATTMVRDEKVKHRILRIFKIWDQRQVYDEEFLADLSGLLSAAPKKKVEPQPTVTNEEFQAALLISTMRSCANLEQATDARLRDLRDSNVDIDNAEELCASLKDRRHVEDAEKEVDTAVQSIENYVKALEAEIRERTQVLDLLEQADQFYETQRGEVKIVTNAYRNFGSRVKNLKKKLDELLPTLISPIPSPDINAPSPSPDSDIELPGEDGLSGNQTDSMMADIAPPSMYNSYGLDYDPMPVPAPELASGNSTSDFTNNFSSFMGGNVDFDMRNLFNERSETPTSGSQRYNDSSEAMPIEVINMRPSKIDTSNDDFSISNFLKTVLPGIGSAGTVTESAANPSGIPGLGLDSLDTRPESPQRSEYGLLADPMNTPPSMSSRIMSGSGTPLSGMNNHQMSHSTPLPLSRSITSDSHTPSPYSSQNSLSNMTTLPFIDTTLNAPTVNPLPPPPLPPPIFLDEENCYNKLPPKFPTWTSANEATKSESSKWNDKGKSSTNPTWSEDNIEKSKSQWVESVDDRWDSGNETTWTAGMDGKNEILSETPESPPIYEKSSFNTPIEYNDIDSRQTILSSDADVDHRVRTIPMPEELHATHRLMKAADVDHRNLISLTGSPANNASNANEAADSRPNNNNVWTSADQNYRRQQGDIVESVDMEMSDEEGDGKPKSRVLVDVRSQQDRDMRCLIGPSQPMQLPPSGHRQDLDMRMIPLPGNPMARSGPGLQGARLPLPPPLPAPQQFHRGQPDFHGIPSSDFRQDYGPPRQNSQQSVFIPNQQHDFHSVPSDFHQNQVQQAQQDFNLSRQQQQQEYEFQENPQHSRIGMPPDFMGGDPALHGRYPPGMNQIPEHHIHHSQQQQPQQPQQQQQHPQMHHRESPIFHRNERGGRGRGFPRRGRDRFTEEHPQSQMRNTPNRRLRNVENATDIPGNSRVSQGLLQPPDTCVILDDDGLPITRPDLDSTSLNTSEPGMDSLLSSENMEKSISVKSIPQDETSQERRMASSPSSTDNIPGNIVPLNESITSPLCHSRSDNPGQIDKNEDTSGDVISGDTEEATSEDRSQEGSVVARADEPPRQLSEHLEALMNSGKTTGVNELKRQASNGNFGEQIDDDATAIAIKKRTLLPNGPALLPPPGTDLQPIVIYDYDSHNPLANFRPRIPGMPTAVTVSSGGGPFPIWRGTGGGPLRARGGFRGGPRMPWMDRGPRGPPIGNFIPRGNNKRSGGQFRGAPTFRGRGRGGTSW
ncbi:uncharacterized protein [Venturia canescens]|uniref:uncharacterized protein n=1 Tax=Venturia canescens TaxID=32260 RepID=UPI001C9C6E93|nr:uncharacterized protein LOC122412596 [Venturia canescens]